MGSQLQPPTLYPFPTIYKVWLPTSPLTLPTVQARPTPQPPRWLPYCSLSSQPCFHLKDFALTELRSPPPHFLNVFAYMPFCMRSISLPLSSSTTLFCILLHHCTYFYLIYVFINYVPPVGYKFYKFKTLMCFLTAVLLITIWELRPVPDPILGAQ